MIYSINSHPQLFRSHWMLKMILLLFFYVQFVSSSPITSHPCIKKCFDDTKIEPESLTIGEDLRNYKTYASDIDALCVKNSALLKCGMSCSDEEKLELEKFSQSNSYLCMDKLEEFHMIEQCIAADKENNELKECQEKCNMNGEDSIRFDSTSLAIINPKSYEGNDEKCRDLMCTLKCSIASLSSECPGAGQIFKDIARSQVENGLLHLRMDSEDDNSTSRAESDEYLNKLSSDCQYMIDLDIFDKETKVEEPEENGGSEMEKGESEGIGNDGNSTIADDSTQFEFEPSNEPEVPIGPPQEGGTMEPVTEIEGQTETDETVITNDGRAQKPSIIQSTAAIKPKATETKIPVVDLTTEKMIIVDGPNTNKENSQTASSASMTLLLSFLSIIFIYLI